MRCGVARWFMSEAALLCSGCPYKFKGSHLAVQTVLSIYKFQKTVGLESAPKYVEVERVRVNGRCRHKSIEDTGDRAW